MIFKKEKYFQDMGTELKQTLARLCDGAVDVPHIWWNRFDGVKVYPDKELAGFYTDETERYLFIKEWCEEEEDEK